MTAPYGQPTDALPACYRHPGRHTGLRCTRCDRPTCPECLRDASVGQQCVECVNEGSRGVRAPRGGVALTGARLANRPVLVYVLIAVNVIIFAITAVEAGSFAGNTNSPLFNDWVMWPAGAAVNGEWWRVITSGFLHIGFIHLAVNMLSLWMIGRDLERVLGRVRFAAVYFLSLIGGSIGVMLFAAPNSGAAGASTALYGLLGCYLVAVVRLKLDPRSILITLVINVFLTFSLGLSIQGHFGGLVVGAIAMAAIVYAPAKNRQWWQAGTLVALLLVLVLMYVVRAAQLVSALGPGS